MTLAHPGPTAASAVVGYFNLAKWTCLALALVSMGAAATGWGVGFRYVGGDGAEAEKKGAAGKRD